MKNLLSKVRSLLSQPKVKNTFWLSFTISFIPALFLLGYLFFTKVFVFEEVDPIKDWVIYENQDYKFKLPYPPTWSFKEESKEKIVFFSPEQEEIILTITSNVSRGITLCELDPANCNERVGKDKLLATLTEEDLPEGKKISVFFVIGDSDFILSYLMRKAPEGEEALDYNYVFYSMMRNFEIVKEQTEEEAP